MTIYWSNRGISFCWCSPWLVDGSIAAALIPSTSLYQRVRQQSADCRDGVHVCRSLCKMATHALVALLVCSQPNFLVSKMASPAMADLFVWPIGVLVRFNTILGFLEFLIHLLFSVSLRHSFFRSNHGVSTLSLLVSTLPCSKIAS